MAQLPALTPEERARITEIQDLLLDRFVQHREAIEDGQEQRARQLEPEIEDSNVKRKREEVGNSRVA